MKGPMISIVIITAMIAGCLTTLATITFIDGKERAKSDIEYIAIGIIGTMIDHPCTITNKEDPQEFVDMYMLRSEQDYAINRLKRERSLRTCFRNITDADITNIVRSHIKGR